MAEFERAMKGLQQAKLRAGMSSVRLESVLALRRLIWGEKMSDSQKFGVIKFYDIHPINEDEILAKVAARGVSLVLVKRLEMYRSLRGTAIAKFGESRYLAYAKAYTHFVGCFVDLLGGVRMVARKPA